MSGKNDTGPGRAVGSPSDRLAGVLEQDIRRRGLRAGDRYLTNKEAAELLDVSEITAHRAMQILAGQNKIVRRRRAGTFIGPELKHAKASKLRCVHVLMRFRLKNDYPIVRVIEGLRSEMPDVQVQMNFVPEDDPLPFLQDLMDHIEGSESLAGIVAASVTSEVRQFFEGRRLPVVVGGHAEADSGLIWVDRDQRQIGRLLAGYLVEHGHRRIAAVMRELWALGDNVFADGVGAVVAEAGAEFLVRSVRSDEKLTASVTRELLDRSEPVTGLIFRSERHAVWAAETAEAMGLSVPDDVGIVSAMQLAATFRTKYRFPHASFDPREFGAAVGKMLVQWTDGRRPNPDHYEIPVTLINPEQHDAAG